MNPGPAATGPPAALAEGAGAALRPRLAVPAIAAGCGLLVLRPALVAAAGPDPTGVLVALFVALGAVGVAWPVAPTRAARPSPRFLATAALVGIGAFAVGRLLGGGRAPVALSTHVIMLNSLAAAAEEAFFRRLTYAALLPAGVGAALAGSAALFAVVHLTVYGAWVMPVDLAAGLVLGWQRWATGSWAVPAVTHVVANLMIVL